MCKIVSHAAAMPLLIAAVDCSHCAKQLILPHVSQEPLNCAVLCCAVLCCVVLCCAVLLCAVLFYAVLCCSWLGSDALRCAVLCCAVLSCAVLKVACSLTFGVHGAQEVAGQVRKHHDGPKGMSRRESFKLSHVIENRLAKGGSGQGFGPHATQANTLPSLEALPEEPTPQQVCHDANIKQNFNNDDNLMIMIAI